MTDANPVGLGLPSLAEGVEEVEADPVSGCDVMRRCAAPVFDHTRVAVTGWVTGWVSRTHAGGDFGHEQHHRHSKRRKRQSRLQRSPEKHSLNGTPSTTRADALGASAVYEAARRCGTFPAVRDPSGGSRGLTATGLDSADAAAPG
jgi:hypothetical protein